MPEHLSKKPTSTFILMRRGAWARQLRELRSAQKRRINDADGFVLSLATRFRGGMSFHDLGWLTPCQVQQGFEIHSSHRSCLVVVARVKPHGRERTPSPHAGAGGTERGQHRQHSPDRARVTLSTCGNTSAIGPRRITDGAKGVNGAHVLITLALGVDGSPLGTSELFLRNAPLNGATDPANAAPALTQACRGCRRRSHRSPRRQPE